MDVGEKARRPPEGRVTPREVDALVQLVLRLAVDSRHASSPSATSKSPAWIGLQTLVDLARRLPSTGFHRVQGRWAPFGDVPALDVDAKLAALLGEVSTGQLVLAF